MKTYRTLRQPLLLAAVLTLAASIASASQVVVVTPTPGNPTQSGNDLLAALAGISGNSWNKRFVLQIEPGVYSLGNQNIQMKEYVDIAGSGVESTFIYGNGNTAVQGVLRGLIQGADFAELRDLTVRVYSTVDRQYLLPIYLPFSLNTRITNVNTQAFTADEYCGGIFGQGFDGVIENVRVRSVCNGDAFGIVLDGPPISTSSFIARADVVAQSTSTTQFVSGLRLSGGMQPREIRDSSFVGSGGLQAIGLELALNGISPTATMLVLGTTFTGKSGSSHSWGMYQENGSGLSTVFEHSTIQALDSPSSVGIGSLASTTITLENGLVEGSTNTVSSAFIARIGASRMAGGPATAGGGTISCAGVYDENFTFFANTCP